MLMFFLRLGLAAMLLLATAPLAAAAVVAAASAAGPASQSNFCAPGQSPRFVPGFAQLQEQVGAPVGEPTECEHANPDNGDTLQATSTGLAFYRKSTNTPTFTNGTEHWGLTDAGLVFWTGSSIDPPADAAPPSTPPVAPPAPPTEPAPPAEPSPPSTAPSTPSAPTTPAPAANLSLADIATRVGPSVVQVITDRGTGSGVRVDAGILTSAHVVADATRIEVVSNDRRRAVATIQRFDANADLALLQADLALPPVEMEGAAQQRQGDEILVFGYPLGLSDNGGQATLTRGIISSMGKDAHGIVLIQTDAAVNLGNSGGAMVNLRGKLIGLPILIVREEGAQGVSFGVGVDSVSAFLSLPLSAVAPPAPDSIPFRGDPRTIAVQLAELGAGWRIADERTDFLKEGAYVVVYAHGPQGAEDAVLAIGVNVLPDVAAADKAWQDTASKVSAGFGTITPPSIGQATVAEGSGGIISVRSRVKNVIVNATGGSATVKSTMDDIAPFVRAMVDRVYRPNR